MRAAEREAVRVRNEAVVAASPAALWAELIDAAAWPSWYRNAHDVVVEPGPRLGPGARFRWRTFGLPVRSVVTEFDPDNGRLAWDGRSLGSTGWHTWQLQPLGDGRTRVVTEEVQRGAAARLVAPLMRRALRREHQHWILAMAQRAADRA